MYGSEQDGGNGESFGNRVNSTLCTFDTSQEQVQPFVVSEWNVLSIYDGSVFNGSQVKFNIGVRAKRSNVCGKKNKGVFCWWESD